MSIQTSFVCLIALISQLKMVAQESLSQATCLDVLFKQLPSHAKPEC